MKLVIVLLIAIAAAVSVAMSLYNEPGPATTGTAGLAGTVNVGLLFPLTGDLSTYGEDSHAGAMLALDDFNEYLTENGSEWSLGGIVEDSQTSPVVALEKTEALHSKGVKLLVGPGTSASLRNLMGYTAANNMVMISYSSTASSLALPNDNVFRTVPDDNNQGPPIANLMASKGIEVLVPVWRADAWGDGLKETTARSFSGMGGIVGEGIRYSPESPEFSASTSLLAEQVQDYVDEYGADRVGILLISFAEAVQFMQSASEHEILADVGWFGCNGNARIQALVDDPMARDFAHDTDFTAVLFTASENPTNARVSGHIQEELGRLPSVYAYSAYDAVWIAGLAIDAAQSTDTAEIITQIEPVAENHIGAVGPTRLNAAGDLDSLSHDVWTIQDGQWISDA